MNGRAGLLCGWLVDCATVVACGLRRCGSGNLEPSKRVYTPFFCNIVCRCWLFAFLRAGAFAVVVEHALFIGGRCCTARGRSRGIAPVELLLRLSMRLAMTVAAAVAEFAAAVIREVVIDVSTLVGCAAFVLVHTRVAGTA